MSDSAICFDINKLKRCG